MVHVSHLFLSLHKVRTASNTRTADTHTLHTANTDELCLARTTWHGLDDFGDYHCADRREQAHRTTQHQKMAIVELSSLLLLWRQCVQTVVGTATATQYCAVHTESNSEGTDCDSGELFTFAYMHHSATNMSQGSGFRDTACRSVEGQGSPGSEGQRRVKPQGADAAGSI